MYTEIYATFPSEDCGFLLKIIDDKKINHTIHLANNFKNNFHIQHF